MNSIFQKEFYGLLLLIFLCSCSGKENNSNREINKFEKIFYSGKGVGPIKEVILENSIDTALAAKGEKIFISKCLSCHAMTEERKVGPGLKNVTQRRRPEWILNQILNPIEMTQKDSLAKELLSIYLAQMVPMNLTEADARAVLEYLRKAADK